MNLRLKPLENLSSEEGNKQNDLLAQSAEANLVRVTALSPSSKNGDSEKQPAEMNKI